MKGEVEEAHDLFVNIRVCFAAYLAETVEGKEWMQSIDVLTELSCRDSAGAGDGNGYRDEVRRAFVDRHLEPSLSMLLLCVAKIEQHDGLLREDWNKIGSVFLNSRSSKIAFCCLMDYLSVTNAAERERLGRVAAPVSVVSLLESFVQDEHSLFDVIATRIGSEGEEDRVVTLLATLPDRISNVLKEAPQAQSPLSAERFTTTVTTLCFRSWSTASPAHIPRILDKVISIGGPNRCRTLVNALLSIQPVKGTNLSRLQGDIGSLFSSMANSSAKPILRAMDSQAGNRCLQVLIHYLRESQHARQLAGSTLLFKRPLLKPEMVKIFVVAAHSASVKDELFSEVFFLRSVCISWAQQETRSFGDLPLERQRSSSLVLWMKLVPVSLFKEKDDLGLILAEGIQNRLQSPDKSIRFMAMVVAELYSDILDLTEKLRFEREPGLLSAEDQAIETLAHSVLDTEMASEKEQPVDSQSITPTSRPDSPMIKRESDLAESDDDSLEAFNSEEEGDSTLRAKIFAPSSSFRILKLLRNFNRGDEDANDPELIEQAIQNLKKEAERNSLAAKSYAKELAKEVFSVQGSRFPPDSEEKIKPIRFQCLESLVLLDFHSVGEMLVEKVVYGAGSVLSARMEALKLLAFGARKTSGRFDQKDEAAKSNNQDSAETTKTLTGEKLGTVVRQSERALARRKRSETTVVNHFASVAKKLYEKLSWGFSEPQLRGAMDRSVSLSTLPIDLDGRDFALAAQIIATLSVFVSCAGPQCLEIDYLGEDLIRLSLSRAESKEAATRRACMLALGSAADAMSSNALVDLQIRLSASQLSVLDLLERTIKFDPDAPSRRFAASASARWATKLSTHIPEHQSTMLL